MQLRFQRNITRNRLTRGLLAGLLLTPFSNALAADPQSNAALQKQAQAAFKPIQASSSADANGRIALGKMLYFDPRLSRSGTLSCNSCHNLARAGVDNMPVSLGHHWQAGARNSPTVFNSALQVAQFWDGRASTLEEQAKGPILNPVEMALPTAAAAVSRISSVPAYTPLFAKAFPGQSKPVSYDNIANAIGSFERTLSTPSRFDRYLNGDAKALDNKELAGLSRFMAAGCTACHNGVGVGGGMFMKFGLSKGPYWQYTGSKNHDEGIAALSKKEADKYLFKVPSLRNVALTYPYFHDGSVWSLRDAIDVMGQTQLGQKLSATDLDNIAAFLGSLTGQPPASARQLPVLPPDGPTTPRPDFN